MHAGLCITWTLFGCYLVLLLSFQYVLPCSITLLSCHPFCRKIRMLLYMMNNKLQVLLTLLSLPVAVKEVCFLTFHFAFPFPLAQPCPLYDESAHIVSVSKSLRWTKSEVLIYQETVLDPFRSCYLSTEPMSHRSWQIRPNRAILYNSNFFLTRKKSQIEEHNNIVSGNCQQQGAQSLLLIVRKPALSGDLERWRENERQTRSGERWGS